MWSPKMRFISRGMPGMKKASAPPRETAKPGAMPTPFGSGRAPPGTRTWRRLLGVNSKPREANARCITSSEGPWVTGSTPSSPETTSTVRSSSVGPSPPVATRTSTWAASPSSVARMSATSSEITRCSRRTYPRSNRRSASQAALLLTISPRSTSSPMASTAAVPGVAAAPGADAEGTGRDICSGTLFRAFWPVNDVNLGPSEGPRPPATGLRRGTRLRPTRLNLGP